MINKARYGVISTSQLFCIIFASRVVVSLTYVQSVSVGVFSSDILFSFLLSYVLTIVLSIPALLCMKSNKAPTNLKCIRLLYCAYFLLFAAINISRFSYFISSKSSLQMPMVIFIALCVLAAGYGAYLGIEGLGRFSLFCVFALILATLVVILCNIKNFQSLNLYPLWNNEPKNILTNSFLFTSNSIEPLIALSLKDRINKSPQKPYLLGISAGYLVIFLLILFCCGVLGNNANLQSFPIFTLFQMASFFDVSRLDVFHTAYWAFSMVLKSAILIYCASLSIPKMKSNKGKIILMSSLTLCASLLINYVFGTSIVNVSKIVCVVLFVLLVTIVPLLFFILKRGAKNEKNN